ncbi:MAG: cyclic nucleotide-binding domain-containing protein [Myxococcaceae bacterium]
MNQNRDAPDMTPVLRLGLKRVQLDERVLGDDELRTAPFVRILGEDVVRNLMSQGTGKRFADQARVFIEGEPGSTLVLVLKGEVRMFVGTGEDALEICAARKGDVVGEGEVLGLSASRGQTAQARGDVEVVEFSRETVAALIRDVPALGAHLNELHMSRKAAGADLADFLNRW